MRYKCLLIILTACILVLVHLVQAQQPRKVPTIGFLRGPEYPSVYLETFRQGLRELGYVEGQNIAIEYRDAQSHEERYFELASELVQLKVDLIVVGGGAGTVRPVAKATRIVPIVMTNVSDPVGAGFVASFARPGGNVTGLSSVSHDLSGKRLELLKETFPKVSRIAVLFDMSNQTKRDEFKDTASAAQSLEVQVQSLEVQSPNDFEAALKAAAQKRSGALLVLPNGLTNTHRKRVADLAIKSRLPSMWAESQLLDGGGLMSYGPDYADLWHRAAIYVDKILKGARPADLPVERPMKFELVISLKAAKDIGVTIMPNVLARADRVIR
jgi:putative tryptophan/tyrosine transport system substrate-binding protein